MLLSKYQIEFQPEAFTKSHLWNSLKLDNIYIKRSIKSVVGGMLTGIQSREVSGG